MSSSLAGSSYAASNSSYVGPSILSMGAHESLMSAGKYYPTNYENRKNLKTLDEEGRPSISPSSSVSSLPPLERQPRVCREHEHRPGSIQHFHSEPPHETQQPLTLPSWAYSSSPLREIRPGTPPTSNPTSNPTSDQTSDPISNPTDAGIKSEARRRERLRQYNRDIMSQTTLAMARQVSFRDWPNRGGYPPLESLDRLASMSLHENDQHLAQTGDIRAHGAAGGDPGAGAGAASRAATRAASWAAAGAASRAAGIEATPTFIVGSPSPSHHRGAFFVSTAASRRALLDPSLHMSPARAPRPKSPRLAPILGSPSPITPVCLDPGRASPGLLGQSPIKRRPTPFPYREV